MKKLNCLNVITSSKPLKIYLTFTLILTALFITYFTYLKPKPSPTKIPFERHVYRQNIRQESPFKGAKIVHLDLKGAPPKISYYKTLFTLLSKLGATGVLIEYEDMFPYSTHLLKNISALNAYSLEEIKYINDLALENKLEVIPLLQTFGHLEFLLKLEEFSELREVPEYPQVICPTHEKTMNILMEMIDQVLELHPHSKTIHIGADEVYYLGFCDRCANIMNKFNLSKNMLFLEHINAVTSRIHKKYPQIKILMWDDEFRSFNLKELKGGFLSKNIEPVIWKYSKDVYEELGPSLWEMYSEVFPKVWIASAFKGATGQNFWKTTQFQNEEPEDRRIKLIWCTISRDEQRKCNNFAMANERDQIRVGYDYFKIECLQAADKDECMTLLDQEKATLTTLDAGEVFVGGRYNSLVPIAQEVSEGGLQNYYAVAAIKKGTLTQVDSLFDLRGVKACFAGVETFAGWIVPIYTLMNEGGLEIVDCNNHVKSATKYFGPSCAVNCLTNKYNPIGDNSDRLCQLCIGKIPGGRCTSSDPYSGYEGAFRCLLEAGDIAFLKHTTIPSLVTGDEFVSISKDSFELLCKDGSRRPIDDYMSCNWGKVPSDAVVTTSASSFEKRKKIQSFLEKAAKMYSFGNRNNGTNRYDQNRNHDYNRQPQYDQFGNRIDQPENDQYGNRATRYKRQNFGDFGNRQYNQQNNYDQYGRDRPPNRYNYSDHVPYGTDKPPYDQNENSRDGNQAYPFDPHDFNREEYGENIDPYGDRRPPVYNVNNSVPDYYDYNRNNTFYEVFNLFESSPRYGIHGNLLFQDTTRDIAPLGENLQTYSNFLGSSMNIIMGIRVCPVNRMTLCVTSDVERNKCSKMKTALKAHLLKPEMDCFKGHSQIHCMQAVRSGLADVTVLDASDVYTAGLNFDLIPFISEVYNLNEPEYYVVAVAKESDPSTELTYLRGKYTCHGGINTAAGWVYPLAFLISNGWIRPYGCNSIRAAAEYFTKSCVPGAISTEYNTGVPYDNMCDLCHGASFRYCRRDASEDYYGHTGAFRCLVEGGGHVAFVTHTTVTQNTNGKREEWWARDNLNDDFELLCPDGTRAEINEYEKCNLGKVKANAIVTRGGYGYNDTHVNAFINLFLYAQNFYGRKTTDEFSFSMFSSTPPYTDLIFQDATTQLKVIPPEKRHYAEYLGSDFLRARRIVDCHAGSASISASIILLAMSLLTVVVRC